MFQPPKPDAGSETLAALRQHTREIARSVGMLFNGKMNALGSLTLTANVASTSLQDSRLTSDSVVVFDPLTTHAAAELASGTLYVLAANRTKGTWTVTHANAATTDRNFRIMIIG